MSTSFSSSLVLLCVIFCSLPSVIVCCGGSLAVIYKAVDISDSAYYFSHLDYYAGQLTNISRVDEVYLDSGILPENDDFGHSAYDQLSGYFFFTSGNGQYIWAMKKLTGVLTQFAQLPTQYSEVIGLDTVLLADGTAMVVMTTIDTIYGVPIVMQDLKGNVIPGHRLANRPKTLDGACANLLKSIQEPFVLVPSAVKILYSYSSITISTDAVVTASDSDTIYIIDRTILYSIKLSSLPSTLVGISLTNSNSSSGSFSYTMDIQYHINYADPADNRLVIVDKYRLFYVDPSNGIADFIVQLPDGPGFPRTNALFGDQFFFADFWYVYVVGLTYDHSIDTPQPFNSYYARGNFQYFL